MNKDLPKGWVRIALAETGLWSSGGTPSRQHPEYFTNGTIPWVKSGDLPDGPILKTDERITNIALQNSSAKLMPAGTISMALYGATIGKLGLMEFSAATNQACVNVIPDTRLVETKYLFWYLLSERAAFIKKGQGGAQPNISQGIVLAHSFNLAPLAEQRRVVAKLEKLLSQVDASTARLAKVSKILKRFRQSVLAAACSGHLTADWRNQNPDIFLSDADLQRLFECRQAAWKRREFQRTGDKLSTGKFPHSFDPDLDDLPDIPQSWKPVSLSQVALLDVGFAFKSSEFSKEGVRLLRGENMEPGSLRWADIRFWPKEKLKEFEHLLIEEGDIILAMDRPVVSAGLKIARARHEDLPCLLVQRMTRFRMADKKLTPFLYLNLNLRRFIAHLSKGLTGSDLPHITGTGVAEYTFGLPPRAEMEEIVRRVDQLFTLADRIEARFETACTQMQQLTPSLLAKAFRGELVPTEAEIAKSEGREFESAEVLLDRIRGTSAKRMKKSLRPRPS